MKKWLYLIYASVTVLLGLLLRSRASRLAVLPAGDMSPSPEHVFFTAPGVEVDEPTRRAASEFATRKGLTVLDLWPADLSPSVALGQLLALDPQVDATRRFSPSRTGGHAILVQRELWDRAGIAPALDPVSFREAAARLRRYAGTAYGIAIAPDLHGLPEEPRWRAALYSRYGAQLMPMVFVAQLVMIVVPVLGLLRSRVAGLVAAGAFVLHPLIATQGTGLRPRGLVSYSLFRLPIELRTWVIAVFFGKSAPADPDGLIRKAYDALLANGVDAFFEPRAETCPICGGGNLRLHVRSHDTVQSKPGSFTLERCDSCGHIFQNPRLTTEGLDFYYRDAYDGLGESEWESRFDWEEPYYWSRARRIPADFQPKLWLDVGAAYGHFCHIAADVWPDTTFHGLDFGKAIYEAKSRGWVDRAYYGLFPDLVSEMEGQYDVVSMSHYLEHARDPRTEIAAAYRALKPGGYLLIEVPNPASPLSRVLGHWWFQWVQPQHQHFLNEANFRRLFAEVGFEPIRWDWAEAHFPIDFLVAAVHLMDRTAPRPDYPWRPKTSKLARLAHVLVWAASPALLAPAAIIDQVLAGFLEQPGKSMNYGVVAQKAAQPGPTS